MSKISALTALSEAPANDDEFVVVDKSDTTQAATGTTKRVQSQYVTIADASDTVKGKVELATTAETETGTDATRAVTPDAYRDAFATTEAAINHAATEKTTPADADELGLVDSAASYVLKRLTWANVKATLKTYFDTLYQAIVRTNTVTSHATPSINVGTTDIFTITALAEAITSMTTNLTGTPVNGQKLTIRFKDNGTARAITWGASFASRGSTLPTTTVLGKYLYVGFIYNSTASVWDCVATSQEV